MCKMMLIISASRCLHKVSQVFARRYATQGYANVSDNTRSGSNHSHPLHCKYRYFCVIVDLRRTVSSLDHARSAQEWTRNPHKREGTSAGSASRN